jgi:hypothetical protein
VTRRQQLARFAPHAGVALALAVGAGLRLSFHQDIEWKADEQWTYLHAQAMAASGGWPPVGMPSSIGAPNPGMSLWLFAALTRLFGAGTPPDLAGSVQALNVTALIAFTLFVCLAVSRPRREPWLWALGLWAVNPVAIILERKIWPPSTLPLPMVGFLAAWWWRRHPAAAFAWGLLGALMAQVHMGVAFLALAIAAWTLVQDRAAFPWLGWLAGSGLGALPAVPWLLQMLGNGSGAHAHHSASASFYMRWFTQFFGYGAQHTLGQHDFADYLAGPQLGGLATHLMGALQVVLLLAAAVVLVRAFRAALRSHPPPRAILLGDSPETLLISAAFFGYGGLLTLITCFGAGSYRHYMIVIFPIMALWTAMAVFWSDRGARRPWARPILATLCVLTAAMSLGLLAYIDAKGVIAGDFGASWRAQQAGAAPAASPPLGRED